MSVDPLASKYPWNSPYVFSENVVINAVELEGLEKKIIVDNSLEKYGYKEKIHVVTGEQIQKSGAFYQFSKLMVDIGLLDNNSEIHYQHTGMSESFDGTNMNYQANYVASWKFKGQDINMNMSVPVGSVHISGTDLIDYPLALIGTGIFSQVFKQSLRPLYNQTAHNIKNMALGLMKNGSFTEQQAARFANNARNNLKIKFLEATPKDLRKLIFKYNESRGLNKWGTKIYEQLSKSKSDMDIINSAANPQPSLKAVGESIYKELGNESAPILKKYNILPKK